MQLLNDRLLNTIDHVANILVRDIRTGWQAEADFEDVFLYAVGVNCGIAVSSV